MMHATMPAFALVVSMSHIFHLTYIHVHVHVYIYNVYVHWLSQLATGLEELEFENINLVCPISHLKIASPVTIPGSSEVFDKTSVLERIEG